MEDIRRRHSLCLEMEVQILVVFRMLDSVGSDMIRPCTISPSTPYKMHREWFISTITEPRTFEAHTAMRESRLVNSLLVLSMLMVELALMNTKAMAATTIVTTR